MSALLEITEKLQETQEAIVRLENAAADYPDSTSIHLSLGSLQKRQRDLEVQLAKIIASQHVDVTSHSLVSEQKEPERLHLSAIMQRFYDFQVNVLHKEIPQGTEHIVTHEELISDIRRYFGLDESESRLRLEEVRVEHRRRKDLLLTSSALVATCITLCLCVWAIVREGSAASDREWAVPLLTAIVTGLVGYVTGRATK